MKNNIQKYHGFPAERQTLIFNRAVMDNDKDTVYYELLQGSRVRLVIEPERLVAPEATTPRRGYGILVASPPTPTLAAAAGSRRMKVVVVHMGGDKKVQVEVSPTDNVKELRGELERVQREASCVCHPMGTSSF